VANSKAYRIRTWHLGMWLVLAAMVACRSSTNQQMVPKQAASAQSSQQASEQVVPKTVSEQIDKLLDDSWKKNKLTASPIIDDGTYLRRVYLDLVGVIPPAERAKAFFADKSPDKRSKVVNELLASSRYAYNWMNYWDKTLLGNQVRPRLVDRFAFRQWLYQEFRANTRWDFFVTKLMTASGLNSDSKQRLQRLGAGEISEEIDKESKVNGAVNYWLKYAQNPADLSGTTSRVFLGIQIQCAQCHDHKTEAWKQTDFQKFTANFINVRPKQVNGGMKKKKGPQMVEIEDSDRPVRRRKLRNVFKEYSDAKPAALDGTDFSKEKNRRRALAAWMTNPKNPYFSKAIVNRLWALLMGKGVVDPVDDFRKSNPSTNPEVLELLVKDFQEHNYNIQHTLRTITATKAYQRAAVQSGDKNQEYGALWSSYPLKPLGPDKLLDSLVEATGLEPVFERNAGERLERFQFQLRKQFTFLFDIDEASTGENFEGTVPQALFLMNGRVTSGGASAVPGGALIEILKKNSTVDDKIRAIYLRALTREPRANELVMWKEFLNQAKARFQNDEPGERVKGIPVGSRAKNPQGKAFEDMFWVLLNSSEFATNH
jgi:hypothetical protein